MEIEVGSIYRLDHYSNLPTSITLPVSLSSIKAVLVDQKTDEDVTLSFPSSESLMKFFGAEKRSGLMQPNLDERCVISLNVGKKLLTQKISFEVFAAQRGNRSFWGLDFLDDQDHGDDEHISSNAALEIKWGRRRRATFYGKHRTSILPCDVIKGETAMAKSLNEDEDEEEEREEEDDDDKEEFRESLRRTAKKRKCQFKGVKYTNQKKKRKQVKGTTDHDKKPTNPQHRWTAERYKLAEKNMLKIMKAKGAVPGSPILRPELRSEARKLIGDTGLLDHLLKHMAGKLAPGGKERFRRRHNPEGAMEYWLEGADLVEIRKKAGIKDSYWVPPPGWKPGDNPTQDPTCARELMVLKEEVANMKREMEKLACKEKAKNDQTLMAASGEGFGRLNFERSLQPLKEMYEELMKKKAGIEKQLLDISKSLSGMEEDIGGLTSMAKLGLGDDEKGTKGLSEKDKKHTNTGAINNEAEEDTQLKDKSDEQKQQLAQKPPPPPPPPSASTTAAAAEDFERREKQERRQRLKSGFRICKPQGTFLWPNSNSSNSFQVVEDLLALSGYPTPPSVSSSSSSSSSFLLPDHHQHHCDAVVVKKPVAKRAAVTLTYSTASIRGSTTIQSISSPTTISTTIASCSSSTITDTTTHHAHQNFVPDLNEAPPSIISSFT